MSWGDETKSTVLKTLERKQRWTDESRPPPVPTWSLGFWSLPAVFYSFPSWLALFLPTNHFKVICPNSISSHKGVGRQLVHTEVCLVLPAEGKAAKSFITLGWWNVRNDIILPFKIFNYTYWYFNSFSERFQHFKYYRIFKYYRMLIVFPSMCSTLTWLKKSGFNNTKCCLHKLFSLTKVLTDTLIENKRYEPLSIEPCHWLLPLGGHIFSCLKKRKRLYFKYIFSS